MEHQDAADRALITRGQGLTRLAVVAAVSGLATGIVGAAFRVSLGGAAIARADLIGWARQWPLIGWVFPVAVAAVLVAAAAWMVQRFAPIAAGSGVQHVEAVMRHETDPEPLVVLPVKFIGGSLAIGSGLALGREGPTVQMGATIGTRLALRNGLTDGDVRIVQGAAAGAGLAVAFNAPLGGVAFVFEELVRRFSTGIMVATLAACATATLAARAILGDSVDFVVGPLGEPTAWTLGACLLLGALLGVLGAAYNRAILFGLDRIVTVPIPGPLRAAAIGGVVGLIAWVEPRLVGGGDPLVQAALDSSLSLSTLAVFLAARWVLGPLSYAAGTPGGLFAPLLVIGAVVGSLYAWLVAAVLPTVGLDPTMSAIVGMAAFFTAVVRAPLTGTLLVLGMTGTVEPMLPVLGACVSATIVPYLLGNPPIYDTLRERMERQMAAVAKG